MNVIPGEIIISSVGVAENSFVEVYNKTEYEIDLSWWRLAVRGNFFTIPKNTVVMPNSKIIFPPRHTKFTINKNDKVELLYPNGKIAFSYMWTPENDTYVEVANLSYKNNEKQN